MIRAAIKLLLYHSKTRGEPKRTEALPRAYYEAVIDFLCRQNGSLGLVWKIWFGVHLFGALRANSEDYSAFQYKCPFCGGIKNHFGGIKNHFGGIKNHFGGNKNHDSDIRVLFLVEF